MIRKYLLFAALAALQVLSACQPATSPTSSPSAENTQTDATPAGYTLASISGWLWHDVCVSGGDGAPLPTSTPPGCIAQDSALGPYRADGVKDPLEPLIGGVTVSLGKGACPSTGLAETTTITSDISYSFSGLNAGTYCVSIDPQQAPNLDLLRPGEWTYPQVSQDIASTTVDLNAGQNLADVNFGWDYQFQPQSIRIALMDAEGNIAVVDTFVPLNPQRPPVDEGFLPRGGVAEGRIYALDFVHGGVIESGPEGSHHLDFIQGINYGLAVWPGGADSGPRLAWGTTPRGGFGSTQLYDSAIDGSQLKRLLEEEMPTNNPYQVVAQHWSPGGKAIYFSREPYGIGGYIPFPSGSSLYSLELASGEVKPVIEFDPQGRHALCLDALSADFTMTASHCPPSEITIRNLVSGTETTISAPDEVGQPFLLGSTRFSPDNSRVAFAMARGNPDAEQGWVVLSDGLVGGSHVILQSEPGRFFTVLAWLNDETLLIQSNPVACDPSCTTSVWLLTTDGKARTKVSDGTYLTLVDGYQP